MKDFVFVSGNLKKVLYLEEYLDREINHHNLDLVEVQSLDPHEVVEHKVREAFQHLKKPVLIEDTAVWFHAMGKLPGPFIKFFLHELGVKKTCKVLDFSRDRSATASVIYGWFDGEHTKYFEAQIEGTISNQPQGSQGMGWDPIFIPKGLTNTYAEMPRDMYKKYSVRNMAVTKLRKFLDQNWGEL